MARYTPQDFIDAIPGTAGGGINAVAEEVGCGWHTAKRYVKEHDGVKKAFEIEHADWIYPKGSGHPIQNLMGHRFGRLRVMARAENDEQGRVKWICWCDCDNVTTVRGADLKGGVTVSCGCVGRVGGMRNFVQGVDESPYRPKSPQARANCKARKSHEYRDWRDSVIGRDGHCIVCKAKENLRAHHLDNFSQFEDQRFVLDNGVTLCRRHHKSFHRIYGADCVRQQFNEWFDQRCLSKG